MYNPSEPTRHLYRLYRYPKASYQELTHDLMMTGTHAILVDQAPEDEKEYPTIDGYYCFLTVFNPKAEPYEIEGVHEIWHLALDHANEYMNYGIYANGLLVESCSNFYLKQLMNTDL